MAARDPHDVAGLGADRLLEHVGRLPVEAPPRDLEQEAGAGGAGVQLHPDRPAEQMHVAGDRVDRRPGRRPRGRTSPSSSRPAWPRPCRRAAAAPWDERGVVPEPLRLVEDGRSPVAERLPARPARHASSTGAGRSTVWRGSSGAGPGHGREDGPRAVGPRPVHEVVVDLHHDPASGRERNARCRRAAGRRPSPGAHAAIQPASSRAPPGFRAPDGRDAGAAEARPAGAGRAAVERAASATESATDAVQDHVVHDRGACRARSAPR